MTEDAVPKEVMSEEEMDVCMGQGGINTKEVHRSI